MVISLSDEQLQNAYEFIWKRLSEKVTFFIFSHPSNAYSAIYETGFPLNVEGMVTVLESPE